MLTGVYVVVLRGFQALDATKKGLVQCAVSFTRWLERVPFVKKLLGYFRHRNSLCTYSHGDKCMPPPNRYRVRDHNEMNGLGTG